MFDPDTRSKKQSALGTMLEIMEIPERRRDVTSMSNVRWCARNLQINHAKHPMFETARELVRQLLRDKTEMNGPLVGAIARAEAQVSDYEHWPCVVQWLPREDGLVDIRRDDGPDGVLVCDIFDPH